MKDTHILSHKILDIGWKAVDTALSSLYVWTHKLIPSNSVSLQVLFLSLPSYRWGAWSGDKLKEPVVTCREREEQGLGHRLSDSRAHALPSPSCCLLDAWQLGRRGHSPIHSPNSLERLVSYHTYSTTIDCILFWIGWKKKKKDKNDSSFR